MAFGQSTGPAATRRQLDQLLDLVRDAGHADFRDARGPLGLTQRQAAGKFTRDEAEAFIAQLEAAAHSGATVDVTVGADEVPPPKLSASAKALQATPVAELAAELQRRGWIVVEP